MVDCPSENDLMAFVQQCMTAEQGLKVHQHIDLCTTCRILVAELVDSAPSGLASGESPPPWPPPFDPKKEDADKKPASLFELSELGSIDEYRLLRPLGRGAMGLVYLAQDTLLDRQVAIKLISSKRPDPQAPSRFLIEARAIARLQHPNVVSIYRVGELGGQAYLVCEYVEGETLDQIKKPLPWTEVLTLATGLCRGLSAAHRSRVLHRDIKPANVIVSKNGQVKLLDFGLAKILGSSSPNQEPPSTRSPETQLVGTPLYMAPELWRRESASSQSDIYALGAVLYALCTGRTPFEASTLAELGRLVQAGVYPPLQHAAPAVDPRFAAVIERCLHTDPARRFADAIELHDALTQIPVDEPPPLAGGNPYRGLSPFESEHRTLFYGRSAELATVVELLRTEPLVAVVGDSGVGKSSLCRAGVLPLCSEGALGAGGIWDILTMVPGRHPAQVLQKALADVKDGGNVRGLLVFIDQAEELTTISDAAEAARFTDLLRSLTASTPLVRILLTVRADCLARLSPLLSAGNEILRGIFLLPPLGRAGLREVIVRPARLRGYKFESEDLIQELIGATLRTECGLPLLSFALAELWESRDQTRLTIPATALDSIGGVGGALARHAETVLNSLGHQERLAAKRVLSRLVNVDGLRIRRSEAELLRLGPAAQGALDVLLRGRLLAIRSPEGSATYEIAHEALVLSWSTLRSWLAEGRDARVLIQRIEQSATEWERLGRASDALWSGRQLQEAASQLGLIELSELSARDQVFLGACQSAQRRQKRRRYALLVGIPLFGLLIYAAVSYRLHRAVTVQVETQLLEARSALSDAHTHEQKLTALQQSAYAAFDRGDRDGGEREWSEALSEAAATEQSYARASRALELGQLLAPGHTAVHERFVEMLFERALLAEQLHQNRLFDDLRERLELYDRKGSRSGVLTAPAQVELIGVPPKTALTLSAIRKDGAGRRVEVTLSRLATISAQPLVLPPGGYALTLSLAGRAPERHLLQLGHGELLRIVAELPQVADIPPDMVFIPAGRFLYGSAVDESARRGFLRAAPLHPVVTPPFLIARYETTFADWIDYLRALDPQERALRLPRTGNSFQGGLTLTELAGGSYELAFYAGPELYRARAGEPLRYKRRSHRAVQDWLRFPVTGISFDDAQAYVKWLERSGKLPGARLCSEQEWERAARGADDRDYPHGDRLLPDDANFDETYGKEPAAFGPDEVGSHPASCSPYGVFDMAGNALEWVTSSVAKRGCATRGGAYYYGDLTSRLNNRAEWEPNLRNATQGLRICATYRRNPRP
jgi:serine/threonine protein kinase/formylglycine-generating enzyme required for sulfatase activity